MNGDTYYLPAPHHGIPFWNGRTLAKFGALHIPIGYEPRDDSERRSLAKGYYIRDFQVPEGKAYFTEPWESEPWVFPWPLVAPQR